MTSLSLIHSKTKGTSRKKETRAFSIFLLTLFLLTLISTGITGYLSYLYLWEKEKEKIATQFLQKAFEITKRLGETDLETKEEAIQKLEKIWEKDHPSPSEYICLVDEKGHLLYHSMDWERIGEKTGERALQSPPLKDRDLTYLIHHRLAYTGDYLSSQRGRELVALVPVAQKNWLLGIHLDQEEVAREIRQELFYLKWGIFFLAFCFIPLVLFYLVVQFRSIQKENWKVHRAIAKEEKKYRQLVEMAQEGIWKIDGEARTIFVNSSMAEMLGYEPQEMIGKKVFDFMDKVEHKKSEERLRRRERGIGEQQEFTYLHRDGHPVHTLMETVPLFDEDGNYRGALAGIIDITERKKTREELQKKEKFYRSLIEHGHDIITVLDKEGSFQFLSPSVEKLLKYKREELEGKNCFDFIPSQEHNKVRETIEFLLKNPGETYSLQHRFRSKEGEWKTLESIGKAVSLEEDSLSLVVNARDVTRKIKMEEKQRELEKEVFKIQKLQSLGTLAEGLAHELNNLLQTVLGYISLVLGDLSSQKQMSKDLNLALESAKKARDLVNQILLFSRENQPRQEKIDFHRILEKVLEFINPSLPPNITIEKEISSEKIDFWGDPSEINQILFHLLKNSIDSMKGRGGKIEIFLEETSSLPRDVKNTLGQGEALCLKISDEGEGISENILHRVFDPFFTTKGVGEGTGLGLSVLHGVVSRHGGKIKIDTEVGKGTEFAIYFPSGQREVFSADTGEKAWGENRHILVLSQSAIVGKILKDILSSRRCTTRIYSDLEEVKEVLEKGEKGDLLIIEGRSGEEAIIEMVRTIRDQTSLPVIFLIDDFISIDQKEMENFPQVLFLQKPFSSRELLKAVDRLLN